MNYSGDLDNAYVQECGSGRITGAGHRVWLAVGADKISVTITYQEMVCKVWDAMQGWHLLYLSMNAVGRP
jgi:hypothetical protein